MSARVAPSCCATPTNTAHAPPTHTRRASSSRAAPHPPEKLVVHERHAHAARGHRQRPAPALPLRHGRGGVAGVCRRVVLHPGQKLAQRQRGAQPVRARFRVRVSCARVGCGRAACGQAACTHSVRGRPGGRRGVWPGHAAHGHSCTAPATRCDAAAAAAADAHACTPRATR
jgi:hypothetical protein